jgi:hypothetical protein
MLGTLFFIDRAAARKIGGKGGRLLLPITNKTKGNFGMCPTVDGSEKCVVSIASMED